MTEDSDDGRFGGGRARDGSSTFSRRRLLAALSTGAGVMVAGCSGGGGGNGSTDDPSDPNGDGGDGGDGASGTPTPTAAPSTAVPATRTRDPGEAVEPILDIKAMATPTDDWDHSPYSATLHPGGLPMKLTLAPHGANAGNPEAEYEPHLMAENKLVEDNNVWRVKMADGFTWHDGTPAKIEDRFNRVKYDHLRRKKLSAEPIFESVELVDDSTMDHTLRSEVHPLVFLASNKPETYYKADFYKPHLEAMEETGTGREAYLTHQEFTEVTVSPEDWVGTGQFKVSDVGENRVIFDRHEDYPQPYRDYQNIEKLRVPIRAGESAQRLLLEESRTDWFNAGLPTGMVADDLPEGYGFARKRTTKQYSFRFNHGNKHLKRRGVRRAIAYIKRFKAYTRTSPNKYVDPIQDGTTRHMAETWTSDYGERSSQFIDYGDGSEALNEEATAAMQSEGYSKQGGKWVGPDGETPSISISTTPWFIDESQTMVSWMNQFGIPAEITEPAEFWKKHNNPDAEWDMIISFHSRGPNHPSSSYKNDDHWGTKMSKLNDDGERVPAGNRELEYELPTEVGATDLSGETRTVNIPELQDIVTDPSASDEELAEAYRTLMWWWNFHVPDLVAVGGLFMHTGDYDNFHWMDWNNDGQGDAVNQGQFQFSLNAGYVRGKSE